MRQGFTLVEVLLTVALITILSGSALIVSLYALRSNDLNQAVSLVRQTLRRAQTLAQTNARDSTWGLTVQAGSLTLFQGPNFAARIATADEMLEVPNSITPSGLTEVVFSKTTGVPMQSGVLTLTHETAGARSLSINAIGLVEEVQDSIVTFSSERDATLSQTTPGTNMGFSAQLQEYPRTGGYTKRALVWFNLSTIPVGARINAATLRLREVQTYGATRTVAVHRVTRVWSESTATWNSAAAQYHPTASATSSLSWAGTLKSDQWDLTADVQDIVNGTQTNYGWMVKDTQEDSSQAYWYFSSREGADAPTLMVDYDI